MSVIERGALQNLMSKVVELDDRLDVDGSLLYVFGPGTLWVTQEVFQSLKVEERELVVKYGGVDGR